MCVLKDDIGYENERLKIEKKKKLNKDGQCQNEREHTLFEKKNVSCKAT